VVLPKRHSQQKKSVEQENLHQPLLHLVDDLMYSVTLSLRAHTRPHATGASHDLPRE
jgi:hypothetical protein